MEKEAGEEKATTNEEQKKDRRRKEQRDTPLKEKEENKTKIFTNEAWVCERGEKVKRTRGGSRTGEAGELQKDERETTRRRDKKRIRIRMREETLFGRGEIK